MRLSLFKTLSKRSFTVFTVTIALSLNAFSETEVLINPAKKTCAEFDKTVSTGTSKQKLNKFLDLQWKLLMTEFPEYATYVGYPGQNDRLTSQSTLANENRKELTRCQLKSALKISASGLNSEESISLKILQRQLSERVEGLQFPEEYFVIDHLSGVHLNFPDLLFAMQKTTKKDYEDRITRLEKMPVMIDQQMVLMAEGLKKKITPIKMFLENVPAQFDAVLTANAKDSPLFAEFKDIRADITAAEKADLQARAEAVIANKALPALKKLKEYLVKEYIPGARTNIAFTEMPNGKAWYNFNVRMHTTTQMSADQIHELGLSEVARIQKEMLKIKDQVKFKGDLQKFNKYLLTDEKFFFKNKEQLLQTYRDIAKRIDGEMPRLFKVLPRLTYGVMEMPEYKAKTAPAAYYNGGSLEAGRAGFFSANTSNLKGRPIWAMESLTAHEAVPGHHLQIALAQEIENIPKFRQNGGDTAYVEGWALYSESLGEELGLYKDPYSKYGNLGYEMLRAVRLVVDTGMHAKGWSREKAIDFYTANVPEPKEEAVIEINRYVTWPGQALAYKIGQLKFLELKDKAKVALGGKFDIREYHDEVLKHGSLPMDVLDSEFNKWLTKKVASEKKTTKTNSKLQ